MIYLKKNKGIFNRYTEGGLSQRKIETLFGAQCKRLDKAAKGFKRLKTGEAGGGEDGERAERRGVGVERGEVNEE